MNKEAGFSYAVLRYVHDIATAEFVNVGVAMLAPQFNYLAFRRTKSLNRVAGMFPNVNKAALRQALDTIEFSVSNLAEKNALLLAGKNLSELTRLVLPTDDSSLIWGARGSGITSDPEKESESLFLRLVQRYETLESQSSKQIDSTKAWRADVADILYSSNSSASDVRPSEHTIVLGGLGTSNVAVYAPTTMQTVTGSLLASSIPGTIIHDSNWVSTPGLVYPSSNAVFSVLLGGNQVLLTAVPSPSNGATAVAGASIIESGVHSEKNGAPTPMSSLEPMSSNKNQTPR